MVNTTQMSCSILPSTCVVGSDGCSYARAPGFVADGVRLLVRTECTAKYTQTSHEREAQYVLRPHQCCQIPRLAISPTCPPGSSKCTLRPPRCHFPRSNCDILAAQVVLPSHNVVHRFRGNTMVRLRPLAGRDYI